MTEEELEAFKSYPKSKLIAFVSGDIPASPRHIAARYELDRRAGAFGRRLAIAAFIVSILSALIASWSAYLSQQARTAKSAPSTLAEPTPSPK